MSKQSILKSSKQKTSWFLGRISEKLISIKFKSSDKIDKEMLPFNFRSDFGNMNKGGTCELKIYMVCFITSVDIQCLVLFCFSREGFFSSRKKAICFRSSCQAFLARAHVHPWRGTIVMISSWYLLGHLGLFLLGARWWLVVCFGVCLDLSEPS